VHVLKQQLHTEIGDQHACALTDGLSAIAETCDRSHSDFKPVPLLNAGTAGYIFCYCFLFLAKIYRTDLVAISRVGITKAVNSKSEISL